MITYRIDTGLYNAWLCLDTREASLDEISHSVNVKFILFFGRSIPVIRASYFYTFMRANLHK